MTKLFILDLNGTLLHRITKSPVQKLVAMHPKKRQPDCHVMGNPVYFRPGLFQFLDELIQLGDVAVWTSALPKNAVPMVMQAFINILDQAELMKLPAPVPLIAQQNSHIRIHYGRGKEPKKYPLQFIWTQEECDMVGNDEKGRPRFQKNLEKVWKTFPRYAKIDTLIIDDSGSKILAEHEKNHIKIPEFDVSNGDIDHTTDNELEKLLNQLKSNPLIQ